jgi:hypothetical protein
MSDFKSSTPLPNEPTILINNLKLFLEFLLYSMNRLHARIREIFPSREAVNIKDVHSEVVAREV